MASFQAKTGQDSLGKRQKKLSFRSVTTRPVIRNSNKIAKEFKKLKNIIMSSFKAKTGRERSRKNRKENYRSAQFLPNLEQRIKNKNQENLKNLKRSLWLHFKPKQDGSGKEREKKKLIVPISSYPTRNREFRKNSKKKKKNRKN